MTPDSILLYLLAIAVYFLPALMARSKNHHRTEAIFALNLLLGWTLIGWIGAMIWASMPTGKRCPECQKPIDANARICPYCRSKQVKPEDPIDVQT